MQWLTIIWKYVKILAKLILEAENFITTLEHLPDYKKEIEERLKAIEDKLKVS